MIIVVSATSYIWSDKDTHQILNIWWVFQILVGSLNTKNTFPCPDESRHAQSWIWGMLKLSRVFWWSETWEGDLSTSKKIDCSLQRHI